MWRGRFKTSVREQSLGWAGERNIEETSHERIQEPGEPRISTQETPEDWEKLGVGGVWVGGYRER